ncbi:hypothetical protein L914_07431, partial [Phytophthora nicotianae]
MDANLYDTGDDTANPPRTRSKHKKTTTATDEPRADGKERQPVAPPEHHSKQPGHPPRTRGKRKRTATAVDEPPPEHEDQQPDTPGGQP